MTNLAAGTVAGFNGTTQAAIEVAAAAAATTATVSFTNVAEATTLAVTAAAGGVLNSVTVSGTRVDASPEDAIDNLVLAVTAGKNVESVSINTAISSTLTVTNEAGSDKTLSTVDASASTGDISYAAAATVATVKTGAGADEVTLQTAYAAALKAAAVSTGAGDDTITVSVDNAADVAGATAAVDAGDGNDTIKLNIEDNVTYTVKGGAGNDKVEILAGTVKTTDVIDGGEGTDTIALAGQAAYVADDYIVLNKVLKNFEAIQFTGLTAAGDATHAIDASQIAGYKAITFDAGGNIAKVATDQVLSTADDLKAVASGYVAAAASAAPTTTTYAGALHITATADAIVNAFADSAALTVKAETGAGAADVAATLTGDLKTATVTLENGVNTTDDSFSVASVTVNVAPVAAAATGAYTALDALTSLTLTGNGTAYVNVGDVTDPVTLAASKLVLVDASGLNSVDADGNATKGLVFVSSNTAAETIKLGSGIDSVNLGASTYGKVDTIEGLHLVADAADATGKTADFAKSDAIILGVGSTGAAFKAFTTTQTDLDLALKDAAASADNHLVFQLGGNTYIYVDGGDADLIDAQDTVVKLTGSVSVDLLISVLGNDYTA